MSHFHTWFQQCGVYILPDGTPVVAQYFDFDENPRWWFAEIHEDGRMGTLVVGVFPNGSVWNYVAQSDRGVCVPQCSDLMLDDLCPMSLSETTGNWVTRSGVVLALLWAVDGVSDMLGIVAAFAA